jgi:hypothetical protein
VLAEALGERLGERQAFQKAAWQAGLCDHYVDGGLILHYDDRDRLVHLEMYEPAMVRYDGVPLLGRPYGEVLADLRALDCRLVEDDSGHEAPDAGFNWLFTEDFRPCVTPPPCGVCRKVGDDR